ncbi:hypothetical protein VNO80_24635 [Phaseolus coccineus]|uniref:Uncharacterized protein n=1 Tax=Phaseolus coccineus TaxID=3886 RepID=A0AAN9LX17_PHACN
MHTYPMLHASVCDTNVCHASWNGHIAVAYTSWIIEVNESVSTLASFCQCPEAGVKFYSPSLLPQCQILGNLSATVI